ncbi:MAG TPA: Clp protease N-terminal domain-containing protein [Usitatibacter sp.]|nr:Clp protease N-terminal domain-containing protein [Usitatibacter sp.]
MTVAFSSEVEAVLHRGFAKARAAHHLSMTVEHLVLEMLKEPEVAGYLESCGTDVVTLKTLLEAKVASFRTAQIETVETQPNSEFSRVIRRAIDDAGKERRTSIELRDMFLSILEEPKGFAAALLLQRTTNPGAFEQLRARRSRLTKRAP